MERETKAILKTYGTGATTPEKLKNIALQSLDADKAEDITNIELTGRSAIADHMIVASGRSSRQVTAMAEKLAERFKIAGCQDVRVEGMSQANWVIVDAGDIVVHLFRPEVREFYNIEKMWQALPVPLAKSGKHTTTISAS